MRGMRLILCALTLIAASAHGAASDGAPTTPSELKAILQKLVQSSWDLESYRGWWLRDIRGKTPVDDLRSYVLIDPDLKALRTLIVEAEQRASRGDEGGVRTSIQQANAVFLRELANAALVFSYWGDSANNAYHRQLIEGLWRQLDPAETAVAKAKLEADERPLLEQAAAIMRRANPNLFAVGNTARSELQKVQAQLSELYGAERLRVAKAVSAMNRERGILPRGRDRRGTCVPAQQTSRKPQPQLIQPVPKPKYPAYARRVGLAGPVTIHMWISELGCIDRVEIWQSSGAPELDDSALDWAEHDVTYLPAEANGQAIASERSLTITFDLKD
jgi:TonB family protein